jgi:hypothetical protein
MIGWSIFVKISRYASSRSDFSERRKAGDARRRAYGLQISTSSRRLTAMEKQKRRHRETDTTRVLDFVREQPLVCAEAAFAAGFVVGGGLAGDLGIALLGLAARTLVKNTVTDLMNGDRKRRGADDSVASVARDV